MKRAWISVALAALLLLLSRAVLATGDMAADIGLAFALLFALGYTAQFPFASSRFSVAGIQEKLIYAPTIAFGNMLALFAVPALCAYLFHLSLGMLLALYCVVLVGTAFARRGLGSFGRDKAGEKNDREAALSLLFWAAVIITVILGMYYGCWLSGDYTWHGTYMRKLREIAPVSFRNYLVADLPYPQYGHNIWQLFLVLVSYISGQDTAFVWIHTNMFLVVVRLGAFYVMARELFRNSYWARFATFILLVFASLLGLDLGSGDTPLVEHKWSWDVNAYPSVIALAVYLNIALAYVIKGVREAKVYRAELIACSMCLALTHFYYVFLALFVLVAVYAAAWLLRGEELAAYRRQFPQVLLMMLPGVLYAVYYKQLLDSPTVNYIFFSPTAIADIHNPVMYLKNGWPLMNPWRAFLRNPYFTVAIACVIPLAVAAVREDKNRFYKVFIAAPLIMLALIFFNPPLLHVLARVNPALDRFWRIAEILPIVALLAGLFYWLVEERALLRRRSASFIAGALALALIPMMLKYHRAISYNAALWDRTAQQHMAYRSVLLKYVPAGSFVFPDPQIAWTWPTIFPHYMYIHPYPGGLPPNFDPKPRMDMWKAFFDQPVTEAEVRELAGRGIDCLILTRQSFDKKAKELEAFMAYFEPPVFVNEMGLVVVNFKKSQGAPYGTGK